MALEDAPTSALEDLDQKVDAAFVADGLTLDASATPGIQTPDIPAPESNEFNEPSKAAFDALNHALSGAAGSFAEAALGIGATKQRQADMEKRQRRDAAILSVITFNNLSDGLQNDFKSLAEKIYDYLKSIGYTDENIAELSESPDGLKDALENNPLLQMQVETLVQNVVQETGQSHERAEEFALETFNELVQTHATQANDIKVENTSHVSGLGMLAALDLNAIGAAPENFANDLEAQMTANQQAREDLQSMIDDLQSGINYLTGPHANDDPEAIMEAVDAAQEKIEAFEEQIEQTHKMDSLFQEIGRFMEENKDLLPDPNNPDRELDSQAVINLAFNDEALFNAYQEDTENQDPNVKRDTFVNVAMEMGASEEQAISAYGDLQFLEQQQASIFSTQGILDAASNAYDSVMGAIGGITDFFSGEEEINYAAFISEQEQQIRDLETQRYNLETEMNVVWGDGDLTGPIGGYYNDKLSSLSDQIGTMQTQLDQFKDLNGQIEQMRAFKADVDYHAEAGIPHHFSPEKAAEMLAQMETEIETLRNEILGTQEGEAVLANDQTSEATEVETADAPAPSPDMAQMFFDTHRAEINALMMEAHPEGLTPEALALALREMGASESEIDRLTSIIEQTPEMTVLNAEQDGPNSTFNAGPVDPGLNQTYGAG